MLTGAGERVFCGGMDMRRRSRRRSGSRAASGSTPQDFEGLRAVQTATLAGFDLRKPLVCAVNGHARALGCDILLAAEIRYAVPHATFALEEVARGLYPTGHATVMLARQIGWVHAHELMLTARPIDARARRRDRPRSTASCRRTRCSPPRSRPPTRSPPTRRSRCARRAAACASSSHRSLAEAYALQEELGRPLRRSEDAAEATRAFGEKRAPVWKGR